MRHRPLFHTIWSYLGHTVWQKQPPRGQSVRCRGPWRWRLAWRFGTVWTRLFPSCHLVSLLTDAQLGSTHGVSNSGPACIFVHPWCITNESPAWTNGLVKKKKKSLRTTHSLSLAPSTKRPLDSKINQLPPLVMVIGSYSFWVLSVVLRGQRLPLWLIFFVAADI